MVNVKEIDHELKGNVLEKYLQVESELKKLFKKYGVTNFQELKSVFEEIPEEEGLEDYFLACNLEAMRKKLERILKTLEENSD
jgi:glutaminase